MIKRRGALGLMGGMATFVLSGCGMFGGSSTYRFRMTVEVDTPQGLKTGSSVYEVWATTNNTRLLPEEHARDWRVKGEAVAVDLGGRQFVFALLKTGAIQGDLAGLSMTALDPAFHNDIVESAARIAGGDGTRARADVARKDWPMLVRFGDINDPKSVEAVDPDRIGVKRIWVETTKDDVTTGIEKRLGWLPNQQGSFVRRLSVPDPTNPPIAAILNKRDFSTEIGK